VALTLGPSVREAHPSVRVIGYGCAVPVCQVRDNSTKLRPERHAGKLLTKVEKTRGTRLGGNIVLPPDNRPTLSDLGITKMQSSRWQAEVGPFSRTRKTHHDWKKCLDNEVQPATMRAHAAT